jgi:hypothetical protein
VQKLMNGQKARFVFTDPPWNVDYGSDTRHPSWKPRQILNDNMSTEEFGAFLCARGMRATLTVKVRYGG